MLLAGCCRPWVGVVVCDGGLLFVGGGLSFVVWDGCSWWRVVICGGVLSLMDGGWSFVGGCHHKRVVSRGHLGMWGLHLWGMVVHRGSLLSVCKMWLSMGGSLSLHGAWLSVDGELSSMGVGMSSSVDRHWLSMWHTQHAMSATTIAVLRCCCRCCCCCCCCCWGGDGW